PARLSATAGQIPPAENLGSPAPFFVLGQVTSSRRRFYSAHSALPFVVECCFFQFGMGKQKPLLPFRQAGSGNPMMFGYLLTLSLSGLASGFCPRYALDRPRLNIAPRLDQLWRVACATGVSGQIE